MRALFYLIIFTSTYVKSAQILGIFHEKSFSHQQLGTKLLYELAERGHDVTLLTTVIPKSQPKNFTTIKLDMQGHSTGSNEDLFHFNNLNMFQQLSIVNAAELIWVETLLNDTNLQKLLRSNKSFDMVIMEQLGTHALKGICHYYDAHCVMLSTMGSTPLTDVQMGNPLNPSYVPYRFLNYSSKMSFWQRLHNSFAVLVNYLFFYYGSLPQQNVIMKKYFPNPPELSDLIYNVSLMLVNSHYSTSVLVANVPNVIEIGGYHIDPPKELPEEIQKYLDDAMDGAIYFNMGSILQSKSIDTEKLQCILRVFTKLKQKILWKFESNELNIKADNIKVLNWLPQKDILAHPNIRLFITHGGLLSTTEALYFGVPIIGIPIFADQGLNVALAEHLGYGVAVPYSSLNEGRFEEAVNLVLNNRTFTDVALQKSKIFHDRPMKPLDTAVYWIEHCLRHNGTKHLRSAALNYNCKLKTAATNVLLESWPDPNQNQFTLGQHHTKKTQLENTISELRHQRRDRLRKSPRFYALARVLAGNVITYKRYSSN
ncbi:hypothetical protein FQR65_LT18418 [Abscondita terminalis]|nr:hypothetical protein FQR65_LT18418 [Abscondita terminalis]